MRTKSPSGEIHIGSLIKKQIKAQNFRQTDLIKALGMSRQNLNHIFKRASIDSYQLYRIGEILNFDFFSYYNSKSQSEIVHLKEKLKYNEQLNKILLDEINRLKK